MAQLHVHQQLDGSVARDSKLDRLCTLAATRPQPARSTKAAPSRPPATHDDDDDESHALRLLLLQDTQRVHDAEPSQSTNTRDASISAQDSTTSGDEGDTTPAYTDDATWFWAPMHRALSLATTSSFDLTEQWMADSHLHESTPPSSPIHAQRVASPRPSAPSARVELSHPALESAAKLLRSSSSNDATPSSSDKSTANSRCGNKQHQQNNPATASSARRVPDISEALNPDSRCQKIATPSKSIKLQRRAEIAQSNNSNVVRRRRRKRIKIALVPKEENTLGITPSTRLQRMIAYHRRQKRMQQQRQSSAPPSPSQSPPPNASFDPPDSPEPPNSPVYAPASPPLALYTNEGSFWAPLMSALDTMSEDFNLAAHISQETIDMLSLPDDERHRAYCRAYYYRQKALREANARVVAPPAVARRSGRAVARPPGSNASNSRQETLKAPSRQAAATPTGLSGNANTVHPTRSQRLQHPAMSSEQDHAVVPVLGRPKRKPTEDEPPRRLRPLLPRPNIAEYLANSMAPDGASLASTDAASLAIAGPIEMTNSETCGGAAAIPLATGLWITQGLDPPLPAEACATDRANAPLEGIIDDPNESNVDVSASSIVAAWELLCNATTNASAFSLDGFDVDATEDELPEGIEDGLPEGIEDELPEETEDGLPEGIDDEWADGVEDGLPDEGIEDVLPEGIEDVEIEGIEDVLSEEAVEDSAAMDHGIPFDTASPAPVSDDSQLVDAPELPQSPITSSGLVNGPMSVDTAGSRVMVTAAAASIASAWKLISDATSQASPFSLSECGFDLAAEGHAVVHEVPREEQLENSAVNAVADGGVPPPYNDERFLQLKAAAQSAMMAESLDQLLVQRRGVLWKDQVGDTREIVEVDV